MKKFSKYFCLSALALGLWSCSKDELVETPTFQGNEAAMIVNIYGASGLTRAMDESEKDDNGNDNYADGSDEENAVGTLSFYFYDNAGDYVTAVENVTYTPIENRTDNNFLVEEIGQSKIVLTGLTGKNYPSYMVAVLNKGVTVLSLKNKSLDEAAEAIREEELWEGAEGSETNFVMTSATHNTAPNTAAGKFFATPLKEKNFAEMAGNEKPDDDWTVDPTKAEAVDIYVERLAAKVNLNLSKFTKTGDIYQMTLDTEYNIDGTQQKPVIQLLGWGLNGTAKEVKIFKEVNSNFRTDDGWDYAGTNRCYWAKTPYYGDNQFSYPANFADVDEKYVKQGSTDLVDNLAGYDSPKEKLNYISWNQVKNNKFTTTTKYVRPHTDRKDQILDVNGNLIHGGVTEVLIAAQIVAPKVTVEGEGDDAVETKTYEPLTLYQLGMQFFTEDNVIPHVLNSVVNLNVWKIADNPETEDIVETKQIEASDLKIEFVFDGVFKLAFKDVATANQAWYKDSQCTEESKWADNKEILTYINSHLPEKQTYAYVNGMMYYNIPIRHLRGFGTNNAIQTGTYGVVRNHCYDITVNSITNLGNAVYRPNEDIIPSSDPTRFMIGSSIKILSWRMVNQSVDL